MEEKGQLPDIVVVVRYIFVVCRGCVGATAAPLRRGLLPSYYILWACIHILQVHIPICIPFSSTSPLVRQRALAAPAVKVLAAGEGKGGGANHLCHHHHHHHNHHHHHHVHHPRRRHDHYHHHHHHHRQPVTISKQKRNTQSLTTTPPRPLPTTRHASREHQQIAA